VAGVIVDIGEVPLIGVAQAALAGYRLDADYRHQLYMSGQETFVITAQRLALCNSGDTAGGRDRVVGYGAWSFCRGAAVPDEARKRPRTSSLL
jgi:hypothetical protein